MRVSITRLRLRSFWFELPFLWHAVRSDIQAKRADGCLGVNIRRTDGAYWTMTLWRDTAAMRAFMLSGAHKDAMPKLQNWCSEASLTHWEQDDATMPTWDEGERHLATEGRVSHVKHPSPAQAAGNTSGSCA
jgi:heme-degrading monooxygenase HmoA